jgi:hypothetical protein
LKSKPETYQESHVELRLDLHEPEFGLGFSEAARVLRGGHRKQKSESFQRSHLQTFAEKKFELDQAEFVALKNCFIVFLLLRLERAVAVHACTHAADMFVDIQAEVGGDCQLR